eukprot:987105-Rhodomonas_salina.1
MELPKVEDVRLPVAVAAGGRASEREGGEAEAKRSSDALERVERTAGAREGGAGGECEEARQRRAFVQPARSADPNHPLNIRGNMLSASCDTSVCSSVGSLSLSPPSSLFFFFFCSSSSPFSHASLQTSASHSCCWTCGLTARA